MKKNLKKMAFVLISAMSLMVFNSCSKSEDKQVRVEASNIPSTYEGRPVTVNPGNIELSSREVVFNVWDSGAVDGDIITLSVNGVKILSNYTLTGEQKAIPVTLSNFGYNNVLLYAHNEGSYSPNTAAVSIVEKNGTEQILTLSADLLTCNATNLYVK